MEVIFQDNIGFIYDVCRVVICKSNKRENWINDFLCDGSEEEDSLYIDNLLKKFQGIDISNKLLGYKPRKNQEALLGELYGSYLEEKLGQVEIEGFLEYVTDSNRLREKISEYYFSVDTKDSNILNEMIFNSQYNLEIKAELYSINLFTEKYIDAIKNEFRCIAEVMKQVYIGDINIEVNKMKESFDIHSFLAELKKYAPNDIWEIGIEKCRVSFSIFNRYLITRLKCNEQNGIIILGYNYEKFFSGKKRLNVDLVNFGNALGDKMRMKMITLLKEEGELTLTDFSNRLDIVNAVALYHIEILKDAKLILRRSQGRRVLYWLNESQFKKAMEEISKFI